MLKKSAVSLFKMKNKKLHSVCTHLACWIDRKFYQAKVKKIIVERERILEDGTKETRKEEEFEIVKPAKQPPKWVLKLYNLFQ